jgi:hypothetical protein
VSERRACQREGLARLIETIGNCQFSRLVVPRGIPNAGSMVSRDTPFGRSQNTNALDRSAALVSCASGDCVRLTPMPQDPIEGTKHFARFTRPNGEAVDGEFLLDGPQTHVILYLDRPSFEPPGEFSTLHADLPAGRWLSFLRCVRLGAEISRTGAERQNQPGPPSSTLCHARQACFSARWANLSAWLRGGRLCINLLRFRCLWV